jgi:hypothetical protein
MTQRTLFHPADVVAAAPTIDNLCSLAATLKRVEHGTACAGCGNPMPPYTEAVVIDELRYCSPRCAKIDQATRCCWCNARAVAVLGEFRDPACERHAAEFAAGYGNVPE